MEIDVRRRAGRIDPLWFGHNLEHTRSCVWRGLSAQRLRNRKFIGATGGDGVIRHWCHIGPPGCLFMPERTGGKRGTGGEAFTAHFDPDDHGALQCQRIQSFRRGSPCGVGQRGILLVGGRGYETRLSVRTDRELTVRVRISSAAGGDHFEASIGVSPGEWRERTFRFKASTTEDDACLEITIDEPGVLCVGAASLLPADHFHGMRRDVVELLKEIGVPVLRWPGGNFAGSYLWKDGLLPVDRRAPRRGDGILPHTDGHDEHEIGTDEFVALCRELDAEPWITINMSLEGPREAGEWVEYCNGSPETPWGRRRAQRGHAEPYNVRYWSLGNEMGWPHMGGPNEPRAYAELAVECARAMKEADPSIVLVASDGPDKERWCTTVPRVAGEWFDHISYHEYTDLVKDYEGEQGRREFERVASASAENLQTMKRIRAWVDANAPTGKSIGITFDEWNIWYAWARVPGVVEGVHTATMLNMFCREARDVGMTLGAYFEPVNEGAILVEPNSCRLTPAGQVFSLFRAHHGRELIETDASSEAALDTVASIDDTAGEVILTLVNRSPDEVAPVDVRLDGVDAVAEVDAVVLTSPDFLPESQFARERLDVTVKDGSVLTASLPPHSVARIRARYR